MVTPMDIPALATAGLTFLGAFTRFTHGQYTPAFYRYQLDHAPDNESTRYIPIMDTIVGALVLLPKTRVIGTLLSTFFLGIGLFLQAQKGGKYLPGAALTFATAVAAFWLSLD
ncbi:hypothetical protein V8F20_007450 [Naviculisporaceae sp. PSN 640]